MSEKKATVIILEDGPPLKVQYTERKNKRGLLRWVYVNPDNPSEYYGFASSTWLRKRFNDDPDSIVIGTYALDLQFEPQEGRWVFVLDNEDMVSRKLPFPKPKIKEVIYE